MPTKETARGRHVAASHNRVEPGDAIGVAIRIPVEHHWVVADLLESGVAPNRVMQQRDPITLYPTIGRDTLDGRPVRHRWVNVLGDPPDGISADDGLGGLACIGVASDPINRMWWRQGLGRVIGRIRLSFNPATFSANVGISTAGGALTVEAQIEPDGEPWEALPQSYYVMGPSADRLIHGDEWGVRRHGSGVVRFMSSSGRASDFETYVGLDDGLGWDYVFPAWTMPTPDD